MKKKLKALRDFMLGPILMVLIGIELTVISLACVLAALAVLGLSFTLIYFVGWLIHKIVVLAFF